eukprot:286221-Pyramimonas_sp.AAC.1
MQRQKHAADHGLLISNTTVQHAPVERLRARQGFTSCGTSVSANWPLIARIQAARHYANPASGKVRSDRCKLADPVRIDKWRQSLERTSAPAWDVDINNHVVSFNELALGQAK